MGDCEFFFLLSGFWTFYIVNPLPCLVSHLLIEKRNNFIMPCLHIIPFRPKKKIPQHGYIKLILIIHKFCLISTLALFIKFCDDTCPFISEHLLSFYSLVTLPTDPHLQTLFTKCTWLIKVKFRLNLFTWIDSRFNTFLS